MVTKVKSPMHLLSFLNNPYLTVSNPRMSAEHTMNLLKTPTTKTNQEKTEPTASLPLMLPAHIGVGKADACLHIVCATSH